MVTDVADLATIKKNLDLIRSTRRPGQGQQEVLPAKKRVKVLTIIQVVIFLELENELDFIYYRKISYASE